MGSFLVAFAAVSRQELVGLALGSRWGRPSPLAEPLLQQVGPPNGKHQSTGPELQHCVGRIFVQAQNRSFVK